MLHGCLLFSFLTYALYTGVMGPSNGEGRARQDQRARKASGSTSGNNEGKTVIPLAPPCKLRLIYTFIFALKE